MSTGFLGPFRRDHEPYSLFTELLDWMLVPLMLLWPISFVVTFVVAYDIAQRPYDRALADTARVLAEQVSANARGGISVTLPNPAQAILRSDEFDTVYFRITGPDGTHVSGDIELGLPADEEIPLDEVKFRDQRLQGQEVRVAYLLFEANAERHIKSLVQVGETLGKRNKLATEITSVVMIILFLLIPLLMLLIWFGLTRGLAPLEKLKVRIDRRLPNDLSPINPRDAPEELGPLVTTINAQMSRVERNLRVQQRFIADAAHQMKTPLAGLKTQAELALSEPASEPAQHRLRQMSQSVDSTSRLVSQLLALARSEDVEARPYVMQPLELNAVVRELALEWADRAIAKSIDLSFDTLTDTVYVRGDTLLLHELFNNLIENAILYTPAGGAVTVRIGQVKPNERSVQVEIEDTGIGISDTDRELVFERFYRVLGTGTSGSGLGLAIVRAIAKQHHASVALRPNPHRSGTVAIVTFQVIDEPATP